VAAHRGIKIGYTQANPHENEEAYPSVKTVWKHGRTSQCHTEAHNATTKWRNVILNDSVIIMETVHCLTLMYIEH